MFIGRYTSTLGRIFPTSGSILCVFPCTCFTDVCKVMQKLDLEKMKLFFVVVRRDQVLGMGDNNKTAIIGNEI